MATPSSSSKPKPKPKSKSKSKKATTVATTDAPYGILFKAGASMPEPQNVVPANGNTFQLDELRTLIGCKYVAMVEMNDGTIMLMDEEACGKQLMQNFHIYVHYDQLLLFGNVIVCSSDMFE